MKLILFLTVFFTISVSVFAQTKPAESSHPVETFFMSGIAEFNAHNLDGFLKQFDSDIEMYTPTGWLRGADAVRTRFAHTFTQFPKVRMEIEDLKVREINKETVVTDFKWRVYPMGAGPAFHGVGSRVYVLRNGKWAEVLEHETVVKIDEGLGIGSK